jgi:general secretion pathway protein G
MKATLFRARRGRAVRSGFTLIEILVVIVVIAILATLVAPNVFKHVGEAKVATAKAQMEELSSALDSYRLDMGVYPTTDQGLAALIQVPTIDAPANWRGPYLSKAVPLDPWGRPYIYLYPGQQNPMGPTHFDLISYGLDGQPGGEAKTENEDIYGWQ